MFFFMVVVLIFLFVFSSSLKKLRNWVFSFIKFLFWCMIFFLMSIFKWFLFFFNRVSVFEYWKLSIFFFLNIFINSFLVIKIVFIILWIDWNIYIVFFLKKFGEVILNGWKNLVFYVKKYINSEVKGGKCWSING